MITNSLAAARKRREGIPPLWIVGHVGIACNRIPEHTLTSIPEYLHPSIFQSRTLQDSGILIHFSIYVHRAVDIFTIIIVTSKDYDMLIRKNPLYFSLVGHRNPRSTSLQPIILYPHLPSQSDCALEREALLRSQSIKHCQLPLNSPYGLCSPCRHSAIPPAHLFSQ